MPEQEAATLESLSDLRTPWLIHVVATLRIADHIAAGIDQIDALAAAAGCDSYALHRTLTSLANKGVFEETAPGRFALNHLSRGLLNPQQRIGLDLDGIGGRMARAWGTLLSYVRTGKPAYHEVFGLPFWEDLDANPKIAASFDDLIGLIGHGAPNPDFQIIGGWEKARRVVDVGGGTGAMLAAILRIHPEVHGTLIDLPRTVMLADETFRAAGVAERVTMAPQSFFDPLPAGADIYLLKGILNDWPDAEAKMILGRCAEAARPDGRVIILGGVAPEGSPKELEIEMALVGGKHRTVAEFRELAREAGLEVLVAESQPSGYFVTECRPLTTARI
jgi:SAM-dependent methyltransferase